MTPQPANQLIPDFDGINVVTTQPGRIDPLTRAVLFQLSEPPTASAILMQASLRAIALAPRVSDGTGAWGGVPLAWLLDDEVNAPLDEAAAALIDEIDTAETAWIADTEDDTEDDTDEAEEFPQVDLVLLTKNGNGNE